MKTATEQIMQAAANTQNISVRKFNLLKLCGKRAEIVDGERRFQTRRLINKVYLMDDRLIDRRDTKH
jgi:hypothetical protein